MQDATPLMQQYASIKSEYPDAILLFRMGDFFETFGDDAIETSRILDIVLTKRSNGSAKDVALAGFPHHALDAYLPKLIKAGKRVALCEQLEDPKHAKGLVKRGVVELITAGLSTHEGTLDSKKNTYLASLYLHKEVLGISLLDLSTGEFWLTSGTIDYIRSLLVRFCPAEIIWSKAQKKELTSRCMPTQATYALDAWAYTPEHAQEILHQHFQTASLRGFGVEEHPEGVVAAGAILRYLQQTQHNQLEHIQSLGRLDKQHYMWMDPFTIQSLEIHSPLALQGSCLLYTIDHTCTPMGGRLLRKWLLLPLCDTQAIQERLDMVEALADLHPEISAQLKPIGDMERLAAKAACARLHPKDMIALEKALDAVSAIQSSLLQQKNPQLSGFAAHMKDHSCIQQDIARSLDAEQIHKGSAVYIRPGIHPQLDELQSIIAHGQETLVEIQQREAQRTGISSLKVSYNKVFGYYLEVTKAHAGKVPADWTRKQTLTNCERYTTPELKSYEEKIVLAQEQALLLQEEVYGALLARTQQCASAIKHNARYVAMLDVYACFAYIAQAYGYNKPVLATHKNIYIQAGRHPVIERQLPPGVSYVPNDITLEPDTAQILLITGPNMAGKSALLRQVALIVLMAQIGCFVPAQAAEIGIVDKLFTRVGASDNLSRGESTFMVEMLESASILNNLGTNSLVLLDEIGRGTSTYDGLSIAWSILEYLHDHVPHPPKTLFATHYHELSALEAKLTRLKNCKVRVEEQGNQVLFLRTLQPGSSEHSFGIHVARMAGMPLGVVERAQEVLHNLETSQPALRPATKTAKAKPQEKTPESILLQEVLTLLNRIDPAHTTPLEALSALYELQKLTQGMQGTST